MGELIFNLNIEDEWPPVAKECLVSSESGKGYEIKVPPFFIKNLSVGDVISVEKDQEGNVTSWVHISKSLRTTIWIMILDEYDIEDELSCLKKHGANIERFPGGRYFSIDVPPDCAAQDLDMCLDSLDSNKVPIAFPSFRHNDE